MANPLDDVTQDRRDDAGNPLRRVYVFGDPDQPVGDPGGSNALSAVSQPAAQPQQQWTMEDLQKGIAALKDYLGGNVEGVNNLAKRFTNYDRQFTSDVLNAPSTIWNNLGKSNEVGQRMLGGENWLSNMVRSATTAPGKAVASETPITSEQMIAPAQDIAGMATGSMLFGRPGAGTLGSGPLRPGAKAVPTEPAPVFYSALEYAATNAAQDVMSPSQWLGFLKNQPGVKAEELAWTGLPEWLQGQKGKVTKEDVKAYLDEHKVEVKDVTKSAGDTPPERQIADIRRQAEEELKDAYGDDWAGMTARERRDMIDEHVEGLQGEFAPVDATKYSDYQLPGGENYREHLLTMPRKGIDQLDQQIERVLQKEGTGSPEYKRLTGERARLKQQEISEPYRSSHWDEPNVLAHVRTNDRFFGDPAAEARYQELRAKENTGQSLSRDELAEMLNHQQSPTGKKSLHIEEIQSDWHQQGRKQGYKSDPVKLTIEPYNDGTSRGFVLQAPDGSNGGTGVFRTRAFAEEALREIEAGNTNAGVGGGEHASMAGRVPDAPFKTSWPELALKRMIRKASEEGYDRISWTPGEAQAVRYDLSKTLDRLEYNPDTQHLIGFKDTNAVVDKKVDPSKLPDFVGKDAAEKLLATKRSNNGMGEYHRLEGDGLKVGGEGMREFYDKMLPKMVEKIGKAHGVKVKQTQIEGSGSVGDLEGSINNVPPSYVYRATPRLQEQFPTIADFVDHYNGLNEAKRGKLIEEAKKQAPRGTTSVHYFDLPESLRHHAVGKGFPLYLSGVPFPLIPVDHDPFRKKEK